MALQVPRMLNSIDFQLVLVRFFIFSLLWIVFTNADLNSLILGIPCISLAVIISINLLPKTEISFMQLISFLPFFLWYSLKGAIDVARLVFHPNMPIEPKIVTYTLRMSSNISKVFMMNLISLLPGTLSVSSNENNVKIHILDAKGDYEMELIKLENYILKIFKQQLMMKESKHEKV